GPKIGVINYINRLAAVMRSAGWTKPLYYNISQSPYYADAVAKANIDGVSFQWYPSGLVGGAALKDNFLPNVDKYTIPYDTIPEFRNKSKMVYEFDAADVLQSCMYPAMAKSFREAGFQWATQFAYDPMALGYANTEYQTHYLSLPYTPSKAISLLITSEVFHKMPRLKNYGNYPADSSFDVFRVSYKESLSEMNTDQKFYYSNTTQTKPVNAGKLMNIAGVGSSPVVHYLGSGAYFLDKLEDGVWRLEVMPDAVHIRDPFERASPKKEVTRGQWQTNDMQITLTDLGNSFSIKGLNDGNSYTATANADNFSIQPGTYLLVRNGKQTTTAKTAIGAIGLNEFVAPKPFNSDIFLQHIPLTETAAGKSFAINAQIVGVDTGRVTLQVNRLGGGQFRSIPMIKTTACNYSATVPVDLLAPGVLNYRIIIQQAANIVVYPGNYKGNPFAWDNYYDETWKTFVVGENTALELFNPATDKDIRTYSSSRPGAQATYIPGEKTGELILRMTVNELSNDHLFGFQYAFIKKLAGRMSDMASFNKLMIRARSAGTQPVKAKITLTDGNASSFSAYVTLNNDFRDIEVPLEQMVPDSSLLLPRPYPGFQPILFKGSGTVFTLAGIEKLQVTIGSDILPEDFNKPYNIEVQSVWLQKK
ncbi:MAG: membrane or secreted protein, partial [Chitinophagaceae bacterium]